MVDWIVRERPRGAQLDGDALLDRARIDAGLDDYGDSWFLEPYRALIGFINADAGLITADGASAQITSFLADRLRFVDYLKRHPEAREETLDVAGIIIGMGRGGSTLLQRLIGASPQLTSTHFWELVEPLPRADETPGDPTPRIERTREFMRLQDEAWPGMVGMHPRDPLIYDEELMLLDRTFDSMMYPLYFRLPHYGEWLLSRDHRPAYAELKLWLQVLQHQAPWRRNKKWLLKSGNHIYADALDATIETFPGARMITTHRPMVKVIPSYASMQSEMLRPTTLGLDPAELGPEIAQIYVEAFKRMIAFRDRHPADMFIDVRYDDLTRDPLGVFARVITGMGLELTPEDEAAAATWMAANGRDTHPRHKYGPEEFGVVPDRFARDFAFYEDRYL